MTNLVRDRREDQAEQESNDAQPAKSNTADDDPENHYDSEESNDPQDDYDISSGLSEAEWYASQYFPEQVKYWVSVPHAQLLKEIAWALERDHKRGTKREQKLPYSATHEGVFEWKRRVMSTMAERVSKFQQFPFPGANPQAASSTFQHEGPILKMPPELLLITIGYLSPADQLAASLVNKQWYSVVERILWNVFQRMPTLPPVDYSEIIDWNTAGQMLSLHPTDDELGHDGYEKQAAELFNGMVETSEGFRNYIPARFTQAKHRSLQAHQDFLLSSHPNTARHNVLNEPFLWLDFSQVEINPYFAALFGNRFQQQHGTISISLQAEVPYCRSLFAARDIVAAPILDKLCMTHITQPPSKCIGIYISLPHQHTLWCVQHIVCEDGIQLGTILNKLLTLTPSLLGRWKEDMKRAKSYVASCPWDHFIAHKKLSCWEVQPSPTFYLVFDNRFGPIYHRTSHHSLIPTIDRSRYFGFFHQWRSELGGELDASLRPVMYPFDRECPVPPS